MKKTFWAIVIGVLAPALAGAESLDIQAQKLSASLQEISQLSGVYIAFAADIADDRKAQDVPALKGDFTLATALDKLLAPTGLTYHVQDASRIEISSIDEITIRGRYEKLSAMKKEYQQLENQFYKEYNQLNTDHQWDINCDMQAPIGSHFQTRTCTPVFVDRAMYDATWGGGSSYAVIHSKIPTYQENMRQQVAKNPRLRELLMKCSAAAKRYESVRKEKFGGGRLFVWD
jgi:hypothetical protein